MSKEHKIKLAVVYCQRCRASHPPGEHLARPKAQAKYQHTTVAASIPADKKTAAAVDKAAAAQDRKMKKNLTHTVYPISGMEPVKPMKDGAPVRRMTHTIYPVAEGGDPRLNKLADKAAKEAMADMEKGYPTGAQNAKALAQPIKKARDLMAAKVMAATDLNEATLEQAMVDVLNTPGVAIKPTAIITPARKARTKAQALALVAAEEARKRELKSARQARWRAGKKKPKKRKVKK